ncbi:sensor histidine kinase [Bacteroidales bacterium AH-315-I05]|nr:sensor histidine kinase [Bacteroidales bacterium AH-315-I05]
MNRLSPKKIAFIVAAVISVIMTAVAVIISDFTFWLQLVLSLVICFAGVYFLIYFLLEKFINQKVKLIYRTIRSGKMPKEQNVSVDMNSVVLGEVGKEVEQWAASQQKEIEQLKVQETYRREFIGNVAHELKTPIFNIQGYVLTLLEGGLEDKNINREYLLRAEKSVDRMINIVEDLDNIALHEAGQLQLETEKFNITALAKEMMNSLELKAADSNIIFKIDRKYDSPVLVLADKQRIRQVLTNLLVNGIHYGKENGHIELRFQDMDENIMVEIADDGLGISEKHLSRLFERFYRVDTGRSREKGGTGLGLAIVKHIIDAHNQTISVRSTEGMGSTFSFTLQKA